MDTGQTYLNSGWKALSWIAEITLRLVDPLTGHTPGLCSIVEQRTAVMSRILPVRGQRSERRGRPNRPLVTSAAKVTGEPGVDVRHIFDLPIPSNKLTAGGVKWLY